MDRFEVGISALAVLVSAVAAALAVRAARIQARSTVRAAHVTGDDQYAQWTREVRLAAAHDFLSAAKAFSHAHTEVCKFYRVHTVVPSADEFAKLRELLQELEAARDRTWACGPAEIMNITYWMFIHAGCLLSAARYPPPVEGTEEFQREWEYGHELEIALSCDLPNSVQRWFHLPVG